jgi:hypothetical protein
VVIARRSLIGILLTLLAGVPVEAEPVKVRLPEGISRGLLVVRPPGGEPIAYGELVQKRFGAGSRVGSC